MGWEIPQTSDQAAVYMVSVLASISISLARRILMHYVSALARNIERADTLNYPSAKAFHHLGRSRPNVQLRVQGISTWRPPLLIAITPSGPEHRKLHNELGYCVNFVHAN